MSHIKIVQKFLTWFGWLKINKTSEILSSFVSQEDGLNTGSSLMGQHYTPT